MNPLAILGLIQLGASLISGFRSAQAASEQEAQANALLGRQLQANESLVNLAAKLANQRYEGQLSPYYSALQGRAQEQANAAVGAAGLVNSGLATAAASDISSQVTAQMSRDLAQLDMQKTQPLLQAMGIQSQTYADQARLRFGLSQEYGKNGPDLSWLALLLYNNPNLFSFGGSGSGSAPSPIPMSGSSGFGLSQNYTPPAF